MKNSYLEKRKRRIKVARAIVILLIVLLALNYGLLYLYKFILGIIFVVALDILSIYFFCLSLGIKLPKRKVPEWLTDQIGALEKKYQEVYDSVDREENYSISRHNGSCPKCDALSKDIVDKIGMVRGEVDGDFFLGSGSIEGETNTESVNHCNKCGHEWKKEETDWSKKRESAMNQMLDQIYDFFNNNQDNTSDQLKKYSARAVKIFIKKHDDGYKAEELKKLSKRELRKYGCS